MIEFEVRFLSSRTGQFGGVQAMQDFIYEGLKGELADAYKSEELLGNRAFTKFHKSIKWPTKKPPAVITLDERVITFAGTWPTIESLKTFQPWNRKTEKPG